MAIDHQQKIDDVHTTWTQTLDTDEDLTTASSVSVYVQDPDGALAVSGVAGTLADADTVSYQFASGDLTMAGGHDAEFHVDWDGAGDLEIFPHNGYFTVGVDNDLSP